MDDLERLLSERACERLLHLYANRIDAYDYDGFMELWAEGGVWNVLGNVMSGLPAIREGLERREDHLICRHFVTNAVIDVIDENRATGYCYTIAFRARHMRGKAPAQMETPQFIVEYHDAFVCDPARGWLFSRRDVTAAFENMRGR
jgi:hypothetical protein